MNRVAMTGMAMAIAYLMTVSAAHAQGQGPRLRGAGPGMMLPVRELSLTDSQQEQVAQIRAANREGVSEAQKRVREAERAQRAAIQTAPMNESLVRSTTQALAAAQTDLAVQEARVYNDVWQVLTLDQQTRLLTRQGAPAGL